MKNNLMISLFGCLLLLACSAKHNAPPPVLVAPVVMDAGTNTDADVNEASVDPSVSELTNQSDDLSQVVFSQDDWSLTLPETGWHKNVSSFGLDLVNDQHHNRMAFIGISEVPPGMSNFKVADIAISRIVDLSDPDVKVERNLKITYLHSDVEWVFTKISTSLGDIMVWNALKGDKAFIFICGGMYEPSETESAAWNKKTCQTVFNSIVLK